MQARGDLSAPLLLLVLPQADLDSRAVSRENASRENASREKGEILRLRCAPTQNDKLSYS